MHLKKIKLAGFKSFVDPTVLDLRSNLVGIVGPNGCGKSNIIDAVRWVMGESSAKTLRGEAGTDVIFSGSSVRKPVGQASVELIFDNSDGTIGGEYAGFSEIAIKRVVNREAQSNYYLNNTRCRRRDITQVFLGTGLGPRSYAIIQQGTVSKFIEAKPEELRVFIEEAAGISKYKDRRRETENKMRHTQDNLDRLNDIRSQQNRLVDRLARQAKTAEKYRELKVSERQFSAELSALSWQQHQQDIASVETKLRDHSVDVEKYQSDSVKHETAIETARIERRELADAHDKIQQGFYQHGSEIAQKEQILASHNQRCEELSKEIEQITANDQELSASIETDQQQLAAAETQQQQLQQEFSGAKTAETAQQEQVATAKTEFEQQEQEWQDFYNNFQEVQQSVELNKVKIESTEQSVHEQHQQIANLKQELSQFSIEDLQQRLSTREEELTAKTAAKQACEAELDANQQQITELRENSSANNQSLNKLHSELQQSQGTLASLTALQAAALAHDDATKTKWLAELHLDQAQQLAQQLTIQSGWEAAVETVLGASLKAVCVENFAQVLSSLSENLDFDLDLIATNDAPTSTTQNYPTITSKITSELALNLQHIYAAETLTEALEWRKTLAAHEAIITKSGLFFGSNWLKIRNGDDVQRGVIAREAEITKLNDRIAELKAEIVNLEQQQEQNLQALAAAEAANGTSLKQYQELQAGLQHIQAKYSAIKAKIEHQAKRAHQIQQDIIQITESAQNKQAALSEYRASLETALDQMVALNERKEPMQLALEAKREQLSALEAALNERAEARHKLELACNAKSSEVQHLTDNIARARGHQQNLNQRLTALQEQLLANQRPQPELQQQLTELLQAKLKIEAEMTKASDALAQIETQISDSERARHEAVQAKEIARNQLEAVKLAREKSLIYLAEAKKQLQELELNPEAVLADLPEDCSVASSTENLAAVQNSIAKLGAINLAAIEEFATESEKLEYLSRQFDDLTEALGILETAIKKIDRETKDKFKETYDFINAEYKKLFPKLFGGGQAYLELTSDDLLNTGVSIMAQPPGKKNTSIYLLSGGEKALTAVALVFAIFKLNPAPFCLLDEVDAPLDDANVNRFCNLVRSMAEDIQYIYISHNKIAMEMAHQLAGVTMKEPGVSRLVAVDLEEASELAESEV